jgi:hypothetical protein
MPDKATFNTPAFLSALLSMLSVRPGPIAIKLGGVDGHPFRVLPGPRSIISGRSSSP